MRIVDCNGISVSLPANFTAIFFRHGDKSYQTPVRGGELTPLGRHQSWSTSWQLIEKFGEKTLKEAEVLASPVRRAMQTANIYMAALGANPELINPTPEFEWGPNDAHGNDIYLLGIITGNSDIRIYIGHNGLFENVANIIHPRPGGWQIEPAQAFIVTESGIEIISPQV